MTSSNEQSPRIRRIAYEPSAALIQPRVMECPYCVASVQTAPADVAPAPAVPVQAGVDHGLPDTEPVRGEVTRVLRLVLEVIDTRRPAPQLAEVAVPTTAAASTASSAGRHIRTDSSREARAGCWPRRAAPA